LRATGGKFANPSGFALHVDAMHAEDGVYLDRGFEATAEVRLVGARIIGELCCTKGIFNNPSGLALTAERIEADDVYLDRGFTAKGQVRFTDAQVKRQFNATGGDFHNERAGTGKPSADSRATPEPKPGRQYTPNSRKVADCHRSPFSPPLPATVTDRPIHILPADSVFGATHGWLVTVTCRTFALVQFPATQQPQVLLQGAEANSAHFR
jgi:hypothetical protein